MVLSGYGHADPGLAPPLPTYRNHLRLNTRLLFRRNGGNICS